MVHLNATSLPSATTSLGETLIYVQCISLGKTLKKKKIAMAVAASTTVAHSTLFVETSGKKLPMALELV